MGPAQIAQMHWLKFDRLPRLCESDLAAVHQMPRVVPCSMRAFAARTRAAKMAVNRYYRCLDDLTGAEYYFDPRTGKPRRRSQRRNHSVMPAPVERCGSGRWRTDYFHHSRPLHASDAPDLFPAFFSSRLVLSRSQPGRFGVSRAEVALFRAPLPRFLSLYAATLFSPEKQQTFTPPRFCPRTTQNIAQIKQGRPGGPSPKSWESLTSPRRSSFPPERRSWCPCATSAPRSRPPSEQFACFTFTTVPPDDTASSKDDVHASFEYRPSETLLARQVQNAIEITQGSLSPSFVLFHLP